MKILKISINDVVHLKKKHPCGCDSFKIKRLGSDIKIECLGCTSEIIISREKLEKSIKSIIPGDEQNECL